MSDAWWWKEETSARCLWLTGNVSSRYATPLGIAHGLSLIWWSLGQPAASSWIPSWPPPPPLSEKREWGIASGGVEARHVCVLLCVHCTHPPQPGTPVPEIARLSAVRVTLTLRGVLLAHSTRVVSSQPLCHTSRSALNIHEQAWATQHSIPKSLASLLNHQFVKATERITDAEA